jgi:hypothetical protein
LRSSRDFPSRDAYLRFLQSLVRQRNQTRQTKWVEERATLRPLPATPLHPCRELRLTITSSSTITVLRNTYSVPSRLIGTLVTVRVRADVLELYVGTSQVLTLERLHGRQQQSINYRHLITSLVRKPGAFAHYRYRDELFPSLTFRKAYDALVRQLPSRAEKEYVAVLHLAATTSEGDVEAALTLLLDQGQTPTLIATCSLVQAPTARTLPALLTPSLDLATYDQLLVSRGAA